MPDLTHEELDELKSATIAQLLASCHELLILKFTTFPISDVDRQYLRYVAPSVEQIYPQIESYHERFFTKHQGFRIIDLEEVKGLKAKHTHEHYSDDSVSPFPGVRELCMTGQCENPARVEGGSDD